MLAVARAGQSEAVVQAEPEVMALEGDAIVVAIGIDCLDRAEVHIEVLQGRGPVGVEEPFYAAANGISCAPLRDPDEIRDIYRRSETIGIGGSELEPAGCGADLDVGQSVPEGQAKPCEQHERCRLLRVESVVGRTDAGPGCPLELVDPERGACLHAEH